MLQSAHWRLCLQPSGADRCQLNGAAKRRWASCWVLRLFLEELDQRAAAAAVICGRCCWISIGISGVPNGWSWGWKPWCGQWPQFETDQKRAAVATPRL